MIAGTLMSDLTSRGVRLSVTADNKLRIDAPKDVLTADVVAKLKSSKAALIEALSNRAVVRESAEEVEPIRPLSANLPCRPHTNPKQWIDAPAPQRTGWIRTTCRLCGGFIGYRRSVNS